MPLDNETDSDYFPHQTPPLGSTSGARPAGEPPEGSGYRRQRTEEIDTQRIRDEAAQQAKRDLLLRQMHGKLEKIDTTQDSVMQSLTKGDRRMDGIDHKIDIHHTELTAQIESVGGKLDGHLKEHAEATKTKQSKWAGVMPQIVATVTGALITAAVIGGIVATIVPSKDEIKKQVRQAVPVQKPQQNP